MPQPAPAYSIILLPAPPDTAWRRRKLEWRVSGPQRAIEKDRPKFGPAAAGSKRSRP